MASAIGRGLLGAPPGAGGDDRAAGGGAALQAARPRHVARAAEGPRGQLDGSSAGAGSALGTATNRARDGCSPAGRGAVLRRGAPHPPRRPESTLKPGSPRPRTGSRRAGIHLGESWVEGRRRAAARALSLTEEDLWSRLRLRWRRSASKLRPSRCPTHGATPSHSTTSGTHRACSLRSSATTAPSSSICAPSSRSSPASTRGRVSPSWESTRTMSQGTRPTVPR